MATSTEHGHGFLMGRGRLRRRTESDLLDGRKFASQCEVSETHYCLVSKNVVVIAFLPPA